MDPARPEPARDRIVALDAIRGAALFGVLMVNVTVFSGPWPLTEHDPWTAWWDRAAYFVVDAFFSDKFFPTFSLLFGAGFGLQLARARGDDGPRAFARRWRRRMAGLFVIGLLHAALLSTIDILVQYAVLGMLLFALRRLGDRSLLTAAAVMLCGPIVILTVWPHWGGYAFGGYDPGEARRMIAGYAGGGFRELEAQRLRDIIEYYKWVGIFAGWPVTSMFVTGYVAARRGIVQSLEAHRPALKRATTVAWLLGLAVTAARVALPAILGYGPSSRDRYWTFYTALEMLGNPAMCIAYVTSFALAFTSAAPGASRVAGWLAAVGRSALTFYVTQSAALSFIFFGLGLYGRVGPAAAAGIAMGIYGTQVVVATRMTRPGPLERLWRRWTYGGVAATP